MVLTKTVTPGKFGGDGGGNMMIFFNKNIIINLNNKIIEIRK